MKEFFATAICCDVTKEEGAESKLTFNGGRAVGALIHVVVFAAVSALVVF